MKRATDVLLDNYLVTLKKHVCGNIFLLPELKDEVFRWTCYIIRGLQQFLFFYGDFSTRYPVCVYFDTTCISLRLAAKIVDVLTCLESEDWIFVSAAVSEVE